MHCVLCSPEDPPRRAVRPPERVRHLRGADAAVPVLPRASPGVDTIARGLTLLYTPASEDTVQLYTVPDTRLSLTPSWYPRPTRTVHLCLGVATPNRATFFFRRDPEIHREIRKAMRDSLDQLWSILHSSWIFPRDNEWIFSGYRALMDLGPNSGPCSGLDGPSGSCPSSGIRAGSEDSLDRRRVDPGSWRDSSSEAWRSRNPGFIITTKIL